MNNIDTTPATAIANNEPIVATADSAFTGRYAAGEAVSFPVAHHDGNYEADPETMVVPNAGETLFRLR